MESTSEVVNKAAPEKSVDEEKQQNAGQQVEVASTRILKNGEKVVKDDTDNGGDEAELKEEMVKEHETTPPIEEDNGQEIVEKEEEVEEEEMEESDSDSVEQRVIEKVVDIPDGSTTTTVTTVKEQSKPNGTTTTKTVTTTKVSKEVTPQTPATTITVITTTPPTPTTEETKLLSTEKKSELPPPTKLHVEEDLEEEEEEEEEDSEKEEQKEEVCTKSVQQQQQRDQISQEAALNEKIVTHAPVAATAKTNEPQIPSPTKQDNLNNTIKDIISSIDSNIIAEENIAALKQREVELLKKQQELAMEIQKQQLLAQKLDSENQLKQQQLQLSSKTQPQTIFTQQAQPTTVSKYSTYEEEKQDENNFTRKTETFETRESTNVSKKIDLQKIFTPATDAEEILPKNRKLYASSAFYSPTLHPTVEDQVELARKISHSLSDMTNQQSKGQSMYVNRKKRSVKWVHEGCGKDYHQYQQQPKPPISPTILPAYSDAAKHRVQLNLHQEQLLEKYAKPGLKVVKTPWDAALESGSASSAFVEDQKLSPYPTPARSPAPQYYDASQGGMAYEPVSVSSSQDNYNKPYSTDSYQEYTPQPQPQHKLPQVQFERREPAVTNPQRDLAYKPSIPQGWRAPSMSLPKDLYVPKEIPLQSYAPPPVAAIPPTTANSMKTSYDNYDQSFKPSVQSQQHTYQPQATAAAAPFAAPTHTSTMPFSVTSSFPITNKPSQMGFSTTYGGRNNQPPKQQYLPPQSYQTQPQCTTQNVPQVNFNPSPLPYDKLAKFENPSNGSYNTSDSRRVYSPPRSANLNVQGGCKVRNTSPAPFGGSPYQQQRRPFTPSFESNTFAGTPTISPRPSSSLQQQPQQYGGGNITPTPMATSFNSNQLMNAPSYNSSARGWRCTGPSSTGYQTSLHQHQQRPMANPKPHIVSAGSMPYTDF